MICYKTTNSWVHCLLFDVRSLQISDTVETSGGRTTSNTRQQLVDPKERKRTRECLESEQRKKGDSFNHSCKAVQIIAHSILHALQLIQIDACE